MVHENKLVFYKTNESTVAELVSVHEKENGEKNFKRWIDKKAQR